MHVWDPSIDIERKPRGMLRHEVHWKVSFSVRGVSAYLTFTAVDAFFKENAVVPKPATEVCIICTSTESHSLSCLWVVMLCCGQLIHRDCKLKWEEASKSARCPFCREPMEKEVLTKQLLMHDVPGVPHDIDGMRATGILQEALGAQKTVRNRLEERDEADRAEFQKKVAVWNEQCWTRDRKARESQLRDYIGFEPGESSQGSSRRRRRRNESPPDESDKDLQPDKDGFTIVRDFDLINAQILAEAEAAAREERALDESKKQELAAFIRDVKLRGFDQLFKNDINPDLWRPTRD